MNHYSDEFYQRLKEGSRRSAEEIVPWLVDWVRPKRVVDVGCGSGEWLAVFQKFGIEDVLGIDGDWVNMDSLQIPENRFARKNLEEPLRMNREFDLVLSLEVAEHLPKKFAKIFIDTLVCLGPVILFSAAVPHQGGDNHLNEQWPEYWARYFLEKGYRPLDCIRNRVWKNQNVEWWYAQNSMLYVKEECLENYPALDRMDGKPNELPLSLIHPGNYLHKMDMLGQRPKSDTKNWAGRLSSILSPHKEN